MIKYMTNSSEEKLMFYIRILAAIGSAVFVFFLMRSCIQQDKDINEIKRNPALTVGTIIDYTVAGKGRDGLKYIYEIDSVKYKGSIALQYRMKCAKGYDSCIGRKYNVIYSKKNPQKSYILVEKAGCNKLGLPIEMAREVDESKGIIIRPEKK